MATLNSDRAIAAMAPRPSKPLNLTAAAETMPWELACKVIGVTGPGEAEALEVQGVSHVENCRLNDGSHETVYVVITGYGVLRCDDLEMQCTAGDVLFVPRGCPHWFERLDGDIKIWRISTFVP